MQTLKTPIRSLAALILLIASLFCSTLVTAQTAVQPQGAGTVASPYLISNWQELYWISQTSTSWDKQFRQTADIDLTQTGRSIKTWNTNAGWTPIGNYSTKFSGKYDGGGYIINGLYIKSPNLTNQAFFGYTAFESDISRLGITGADVSGNSDVGVLVGTHTGTISCCFTSGVVSALNYVGGFAGEIGLGGRISNSFSRVAVTRRALTDTYFGGFAGKNEKGAITNCYATGKISYATGTLPVNNGFVGGVLTGIGYSMTGNYWDIQSSGQSTTAGIASGKNTVEMQRQNTFTGWDFTDIWAIDPQVNGGYPYLIKINTNQLYNPEANIYEISATMNTISVSGALLSIGKSSNAVCGFLINSNSNVNLSTNGHIAKHELGSLTATTDIETIFTGLSANKLFYICAYVTNEHGTFYSPAIYIATMRYSSSKPQGAGTTSSPYLISNWMELYWVSQTRTSWDKQFLQTADIDLALAVPNIKTWYENTGWVPIGNATTSFSGKYDGGGYTINGLYINSPKSDYQALFGVTAVTSEIINLGVTEASVSGQYYVGIFVSSHSGSISNCFASGSVSAIYYYAGGFVGYIDKGRISNSFSRATVFCRDGESWIGGFAGKNYRGKVTNCYATGRVSYDSKYRAPISYGFVGTVDTTTYLVNSFSMAGNYWDTQTSGQTSTGGGYARGKTSVEMKTQTNFTGWDFTDTWAIDPKINAGYPYLKKISTAYLYKAEAYIYDIGSASDAIEMSGALITIGKATSATCGFLIHSTADISLSPSGHIAKHELGVFTNSAEVRTVFTSLIADEDYFVCAYATNEYGTLYSPAIQVTTVGHPSSIPHGAGTEASPYLISNWKELNWISQTVASWSKQFLQTADIDLSPAVPSIKTWNSNTGWMPIGDTYYNVFTGKYDGGGHIIDCLYINRPKRSEQGLFGGIAAGSEITQLGVTDAYVLGDRTVGVLVGDHSGTISNCFTSGSVVANQTAGGFVGVSNDIWGKNNPNSGRISNSYSRASVTRMSGTSTNFGGFVGLSSRGTITKCYSTGRVLYATGTLATDRGFDGDYSNLQTTGNFWDIQTSGQSSTAGAPIGTATGKTTAEMKMRTTFTDAGWDFLGEVANGTEDIWFINSFYNDGYPFLAWQTPDLSFIGGTVYYDRDKSGTYNTGDNLVGRAKVELLPNGTITETVADGSFIFYAPPGEYTVRIIPQDPYFKGTDELEYPAVSELKTVTMLDPIGLYGTDVTDFSLNAATVWSRCGNIVPVYAIVENTGNMPSALTANVKLDSRVSFIASQPVFTEKSPEGEFIFNINDLKPFESRIIRLDVRLPVASVDTISYQFSLKSNGTEIARDELKELIRCSYDPNEVQVIPGGLTEKGYVPMGQELTYLVRFQNTGNDTAFMVDILDTLAPSLDPLSFEMLASSHEMRYFIERNGALRFLFEDINLEDSTSNEPASHGFVLFKVKPRATVTTGTRVGLTAHIYFDSNPAVVTNTALSTFTDQYTKVAQSISLTEGWNLVSFYVQPGDNAIENALSSGIADIEAVKTGDAFYSADHAEWLNSLKTINGGQAYLIKAKRDTELTVNGLLVFKPFEHKLNKGWNMVGCPVITDVAVDPMLKKKPVTEAKDFEGFWRSTTPAGNMINFEPGKGYFIYSDQPAVLPW